MATKFNQIYNCFYSNITDDMYMELDEAQTADLLEELLLNAIPWFEFPRVNLNNYDLNRKTFKATLTYEEANILAIYMVVGWIGQQLASIEQIRMKYSGSDFKFTSQANHIAKLINLQKEYERKGFHLQRLYKRRKADKNGIMRSTFGSIMGGTSAKTTHSGGGAIPEDNGGGSSGGGDSWEDMDDNLEDSSGGSSDSWGDMEDLPGTGGDHWEDLLR